MEKLTKSVYSTIAEKSFEVELYLISDDGKYGIKDTCLEDILVNELPECGATYQLVPRIISNDYYAMECIITDNNGRYIHKVSDVNLKYIAEIRKKNDSEGQGNQGDQGEQNTEEKKFDFEFLHPLVSARQSVIASAVKAYLKWPRLFELEGNPYASNITDDALPKLLDDSDTAATTPNPAPVSVSAPAADVHPNKSQESSKKELKDYSMEELGKEIFSSGKYAGKTLDYIWNVNAQWFSFTSNNPNPKYDFAKEYRKRKEAAG